MPTPKVSRSKWSDAESDALGKAFHATSTADEFFRHLRAQVPSAPQRTVKAYLSRLCMLYPDKSARMRPVYVDLCRANVIEEAAFRAAEEAAKGNASASVEDGTVTEGVSTVGGGDASRPVSWVDEIDSAPVPPSTPPRPAPAPNFVKPAVKPDPNARVPRHIPVPLASHRTFTPGEVAALLGVPPSTVTEALQSRKLPGREIDQTVVVVRPVFDALHAALCEGHSFEHACLLACEKHPAPTPIVSAERLYAVPATEAPGEPDPNKVREGYIPNPFLKGPFLIEKNREAPTLDDPNSDAMDAFTVEEATLALGLSSSVPLLTAITRDGFPAVKIDGKYTITRADLKRVRALLESGLTIEETLKRAGAPAMGLPVTPPAEDSWTDYLAPLTPEESREAGTMTPDEGAVRDARSPASDHLPPPPAEIHVPEVAATEQRQWALEALGEGIFTVEQALKIAGVTDTPRNRWALGLLGRGEINLAQAAKLLR